MPGKRYEFTVQPARRILAWHVCGARVVDRPDVGPSAPRTRDRSMRCPAAQLQIVAKAVKKR
jgi:hypothetical protein